MSHKLKKPYTDKEKSDFIVEYNHNQNLTIEESKQALYALEDWEILQDDKVIDRTELYNQEQEKKEVDRINHLTMTALDFITYIKKAGITDEVILQYLQANPSIQLQLTLCQNVYCGVVRQMCPIKITEELTLTDEQVVNMFKDKNKIV